MIRAVDLEKAPPIEQLTLALVGQPKSWKTNIAASGRKPILILDYDIGSASIITKQGVYAVVLIDPPHPLPQTAIQDTFSILTAIEKSRKLKDLFIGAKPLFPDIDPNLEIKTIVIDSGSSLARASLNFILSSSDALRYTVSVGGLFTNYTPKNWIGWVSDTAMVESIVLRCIATGLDTIFILHEAPEEAVDSTEETPKFTGRVTVYPVRYAKILKNFRDVWRTTLVKGPGAKFIAKVQVTQDWNFNASTCMLLDALEDPDICKMIAKHELRLKGGK